MSDEIQVGIGDWIRFYQGGQLVIGQVEYVKIDSIGQREAWTDIGAVRISHNLISEVRRPKR